MGTNAAAPSKRPLALAALVALVLLVHALVTQGVMQQMQAMSQEQAPTIKRMEATLVADMQLSAPPVAIAPPIAPPPAEQAVAPAAEPPASAASEPASAASKAQAASAAEAAAATDATAQTAAAASEASAPQAVAQAPSTPEAAAPTASAPASAPAFEWPKATRVTFKMEGYFRGPIYGSAKVEWVREGERYQVHIDTIAGPSFAPIASQRFTSEGVIAPEGLRPSRFESTNKLLIKTATPKVVVFEDKEVVMPNGDRLPRLPDVQDPASHLIHLAYQFMLKPQLLKVGGIIEVPMVDTRLQRVVIYDVEGAETLVTPLGKIETLRMKPRVPKAANGDDRLAEIWVAPTLQYLPIRMLLRIGSETYFDMQMDKAPQQAPADAASGAAIKPAAPADAK